MRRVTSVCFIFFIVLTFFLGTALAAPEFKGSINSKIAYMLMDADSGKELHSQNRDIKIEPASTTKILTCLVAIENSSMTDVVKVSEKAANTGGSFLGIKRGEEIVMKDLLVGMMLKSGNDATVAVAEHVSGTVEGFVALMKTKAEEIGMTSSNFTNPNGLHDENHYSTVLDMAKLAQYALKNPTFMQIVGTLEYEMPKTNKQQKRTVENTNQLLDRESENYYEGATGMKTGRTTAAGGCLVASATRNGMNLICVVFNDHTSDRTDRWPATEALFDYGFDNYKTIDMSALISDQQPVQAQIEGFALNDAFSGFLEFKKPGAKETYITLEKSAAQALLDGTDTLEAVPAFDMELKAPIAEGDILGTVTYKSTATGEIVYTDNLIAARDVFEEGSTGGTAVVTLTPAPTSQSDDEKNNQTLALWIIVGISGGLIAFLIIRMMTVRKSRRFKKRRRPHYSYRIK